MSRKLFVSTLVSIPLLMTTTGSGATGIHEPASQSLFDEGRELMIQGNFAEACAKFETSYELEPGLGTLLNLALCHEKRGQLATAYVKYNDAFTLALRAGDEARVALAKKRLDALTPRLSRIVIDADARHLPSGAWITMDGTPMDRALLGVPFPVDGGQHELVIGADGMETVKIIVTVDAEGTTKTVHLPVLESVPRERSGSMECDGENGFIDLTVGSHRSSIIEVGYPGWYEVRRVSLYHGATDAEILYHFGRALGFGHEYDLDGLPGPCIPCEDDADCSIPYRPECLPSGFCGQRSNHQSIMAPPDCGGIEPIRSLSVWDVYGAQRAYGRKPLGSLVSGRANCVHGTIGGAAMLGICEGFVSDRILRRFASVEDEVDQFALPLLSSDLCLQLGAASTPSLVGTGACDSTAATQGFWTGGMKLRGVGGLCVIARAAASGSLLRTALCEDAAPELSHWGVTDSQIRLANTDLCATIPNGVGQLGTHAVLAPCGSVTNGQSFVIREGRLLWRDGLCLQVSGGLPLPGCDVILWNGCGIGAEHARYYLSGPVQVGSGLCLETDEHNVSLASGPCSSTSLQDWDFHF